MSHLMKALLLSSIVVLPLVTGCGDDSQTQATATHTVIVSTVTVTPPATTVQMQATGTVLYESGNGLAGNGYFVVCNGNSARATQDTSCQFSEEMQRRYSATPVSHFNDVYSPVMQREYPMNCSSGFVAQFRNGQRVDAIHCIGGDDDTAEVVIF